MNKFLRLVLVPYLKTGHDSIYMFIFFIYLVYTILNGIDYRTLSLFYATDICLFNGVCRK